VIRESKVLLGKINHFQCCCSSGEVSSLFGRKHVAFVF
jgi:hypothetical protein